MLLTFSEEFPPPLQVDTILMQMQFLFSVLWGLASTVPEQSRKSFDSFFRNLVDGGVIFAVCVIFAVLTRCNVVTTGLVKGHAKPPGFKLGRSNLFGDSGLVFDYMISPEVAGTWCKWEEQMSQVISTTLLL